MDSSPIGIATTDADHGRYELLVNAITDYAIYMLDPAGMVTSWNAGAEQIKGYTAAEIIGRHFSIFYTEEDRAHGVPAVALEAAARVGRFEREGWRVRKDGSRFWANVIVDAIRSPDGELIGFAKITRDLTERREAEAALRRSERDFKLLVQGVTDYAIYMLDREGKITNWNAGAQRIKGYLADEVVGRHFSMFYTEPDRDAGLPAHGLATALAEGRWEHEGLRVRKDGSTFWAHVVIDPIRDEDGEVLGYAKITRDITERREAQRALDATHEALVQSQKMEALGQLTGGVAHDFNNSLMAVLGSLELLKKRLPYDPAHTSLLENAIQGAQRGATLTQRMLAFARRQELKLEAVDLAPLVRSMVGFLQRSIGPAYRIELRFPAGLAPVTTDPAQLENALINLAVNARDAMAEGGVITMAATPLSLAAQHGVVPPGDYVVLTVTDTGEGMSPATLARATEPFFTTKGVGKGTGLGLSMVHGLAAQSGGQLTIESRVGEGTTVQLWLPVAAAAAASAKAAAKAPDKGFSAELRPFLILAVDDDSLVLTNTAALLEDLGHRVLTAKSAKDALELVASHPDLDLVVTDQVMPRMTGLQLQQELARTRPKLPVLLATGYAELPDEICPSLRRIAKPFTQQQLADAVLDAVVSPRG
ncbi:MAG TPA: PAS domain S-box protein [Caulobacteraceae bacterium]|jgi:PAS domain S-box-containing protein